MSTAICEACGVSMDEPDEVCRSCGKPRVSAMPGAADARDILVRVYRRRIDYERDAGRMIHRGWSVAGESTRPRLGAIGRLLHLSPNIEITYKRSWDGSRR
jgi:hypothetical protein